MRVAVVGAGVTGLSAAHELARSGGEVRVTLHEKEDHLGGHAKTVDVGDGSTGPIRLDLGFMIFNQPFVSRARGNYRQDVARIPLRGLEVRCCLCWRHITAICSSCQPPSPRRLSFSGLSKLCRMLCTAPAEKLAPNLLFVRSIPPNS